MNQRPITTLVVTVVLAVGAATFAAPFTPAPASAATAAAASKYRPSLLAALAVAGPTDQISVMVQMTGRGDLHLPAGPRATRRRELIRRLQSLQAQRHPLLLAQLARWKAAGQVTAYQSFWVDNGIAVTATSAVIATIAGRADVESIDLDTGQITPAGTYTTAVTNESNVTTTGAPSLWSRGIDGAGVVVANLDTGVDRTNPDLAASWRGGTDSWFDPYAQNSSPTDFSGHGTWTMSLIVGAGSGGTNIGVAPGARWIAAKIFNNNGTASLSAIHAAFQWVLDPDHNPATDDAPDVVNNSWTSATPGCSTEFQPDLQVLRAAGILPVFAAGNNGPGASTSLSPANLPEAFAVGGVDANNIIDAGSSRGPSSCTGVANYPSAVAPDVNITVADLYGLYTTATGTSFAAPETAGTLALILSQLPTLTADQQAAALTSSAVDLGPAGPDDTFGAGLVSAPSALAAAQAACSAVTTTRVSTSPAVISTAATTVTAHSTACAGHTVTGAEWFLDTTPAAGTGTAFTNATPAFGSGAVDETVTLPPATVTALSSGTHTVFVDALGETGTWGPAVSTSFVVDRTGPTVSAAIATPARAAPTTTITLTANATDPANGSAAGSTIAAAEWFDGSDPGVTNGHPMKAGDGTYNTVTEAVTASIPLTGWTNGTHTISIRAIDTVGNAGAAVTVSVVVDSFGPTVANPTASPTSVPVATTITLTATATDPPNADAAGSSITATEWFDGTDPGTGRGHPMVAVDGAFNSPTEPVTATVDTTGWTSGPHTVSVRGLDAVGNWGSTGTVTVTITTPPDTVFADGFESGNLNAWSAAVTNSGKLSVTGPAARAGTFGLQAQIAGTTAMYVTDTTPTALATYHARFAYAPNSIAITAGKTHDLLDVLDAANAAQATVQVTKNNGNYQIRATTRTGNSTKTTNWYTITNATHSIEIGWQAATTTNGTNGTLTVWIDSAAKQTVTGLTNGTTRIASSRLGPQNIGSGITGTEYLDSFASTRTTYIGP